MIYAAKSVARAAIRSVRARNDRNLFWWQGPPRNFGDWIGPMLYRAITGNEPTYCVTSNRNLQTVHLTVGSLTRWICEDSIVWGSGILHRDEDFWRPYKTCAVRGPRTRDHFHKLGYACPEVFGDPAILLPRYFQPNVEKSCRLGIVPHYGDYDEAWTLFGRNGSVNVIGVTAKPESVITDICSCEAIVSSSLHGLIVAHAYGIPAAWVEFSKPVDGDSVKFLDYFEAGRVGDARPYKITPSSSIGGLCMLADYAPRPLLEGLKNPLLAACPFADAATVAAASQEAWCR